MGWAPRPAPLLEERFAMNDVALGLGKPMVECAKYDFEATITTFAAGGHPRRRMRCRNQLSYA